MIIEMSGIRRELGSPSVPVPGQSIPHDPLCRGSSEELIVKLPTDSAIEHATVDNQANRDYGVVETPKRTGDVPKSELSAPKAALTRLNFQSDKEETNQHERILGCGCSLSRVATHATVGFLGISHAGKGSPKL